MSKNIGVKVSVNAEKKEYKDKTLQEIQDMANVYNQEQIRLAKEKQKEE